MVQGTIKLGRNTVNHGTWLKARGYTVTENGTESITVQGKGSFRDELDLSQETPEARAAALKAVLDSGDLLHYGTKISLHSDGEMKTLFGIPACGKLGAASALIVKKAKPDKAKKAAGEFDGI